jgi:TolC family type I secretion outer membrane protein
MDKVIVISAAVLGVFLPLLAFAGPMTLQDCVSKALAENPNVLDAKEMLSQAGSGVREARAGYLPNLTLAGSYNFMEETQTVGIPDPVTGQTQDFKLDFTRDYVFQLFASQPLYTGGRVASSYRIAKHSLGMMETDLMRVKSEVALEVVEAFYGLLLAREAVGVAEEAVETAEEFLRVVNARYKTGEASSFEVMRAEVEVSNLKPVLITAKNAVALSELALKKSMGVSQNTEIEFVGSFGDPAFGLTLDQAIEAGLRARPEIEVVGYQKRIAEASLGLAKSGRMPSLSLDFNYDVRTDEITFDSDELEDTYAGYLTLSLPLFDGLRTKSQISAAMSELRQADISRRNLEDGIELEVRAAFLEIEAARERLRSQEKNVEMAEEGLEIANERYLQGYATNLEVLDSQLALNTARQNQLQAIHDLNLAIAKMKKAMGTLLSDYETGARR